MQLSIPTQCMSKNTKLEKSQKLDDVINIAIYGKNGITVES